MDKTDDGGYFNLSPEQYAAGIMFCRERTLPVEYGTHVGTTPNLHIKPTTDDDPETPEWTPETVTEFEAVLASA